MWGVFASSGPSARAIRPIPMGRGAGIVTPMERGLPIVQLAGPSSGRPPISRSADRRVTAAGLTAAGTVLAAPGLARPRAAGGGERGRSPCSAASPTWPAWRASAGRRSRRFAVASGRVAGSWLSRTAPGWGRWRRGGGRGPPTGAAPRLVAALAVAAPVVAAGYALRWDALVRAGGLLELAGAVALVGYVAGCIADRGHWTTDAGWHRMAAGHLLAAVAWFTVGVAVVAGRAVVDGADPGGGSAAWAIGPLVVGWGVQAVLGAAGHIVPAIGPGDASRHARQRQLLGTAATARLVTFQLGVAALAVGLPTGAEAGGVGGLIAAGATILATLGLLGWAMIAGAAAESDPLLAHRKAA